MFTTDASPTVAPSGDALTHLSASDMARLVRDGDLDPVDLVEAHLERIESVEPELHAFAAVMAESARAEARALRNRPDLGSLPLAGVPVAVKDNIDIAGEPTTHGSAAASRAPAGSDHDIVARLRAAGAVIIGRTVMPELAVWPFTEPEAYPSPRNPWDTSRTPGGSSGGSAVAVAARMAAVAIGSDGGGSIRVPAACCGLVGVKPAPGLVPVAGGRDGVHWYGLTAFGPIARTVEDAALVLDVLADCARFRDPVAPTQTLRIGIAPRHPVFGARLSTECRDALDEVGAALARAGHTVERVRPPYPMTPTEFINRWLAGIAQDAEGLDAGKLEARTRAMAKRGRKVARKAGPASDSAFARTMSGWFSRCDVLITPTLAAPAVKIGRWRGRGWVSTMLSIARWMGYTSLWNVAGAAAVAVPAGLSGDGLPLSVQLIGPAGSERTLLSVAAQVQELRPWPAAPERPGGRG